MKFSSFLDSLEALSRVYSSFSVISDAFWRSRASQITFGILEWSIFVGWGAPELESRPRTAKSAESESRERQEASVGVFSMLLNVSNRIRAEISSRIAQISLERKIPLRSLKSVIQSDLC